MDDDGNEINIFAIMLRYTAIGFKKTKVCEDSVCIMDTLRTIQVIVKLPQHLFHDLF